jgi:carboxymethylenebutenolidase
MCFDLDSRPPIPPIAGGSVEHERIVLTSADGASVDAFDARLAGLARPGVGVVILPDIRGLYGFYEELAVRFGERGYRAIAIDYFARTAPRVADRTESFAFREHVAHTRPEGVFADITAALNLLRAGGADTLVVVGFCFGGRYAWLSASELEGIVGAVGFYGRPGEISGRGPSPISRAPELKAPILALMGGADQNIPVDDVREYERALLKAGAEHEFVVYPGAPHSFFDQKADAFAEASDDAWDRTLAFIEQQAC